uniref:Alcohol dehydrogenase-like C-terminal domain-containing protein n=1 Tax=Arcella intermedia TaxID=1963864 RepID=A0A6B2LLK5_9EUKA
MAKAWGFQVGGIVGTEEKAAQLKKLIEIDYVFSYKNKQKGALEQEIKERIPSGVDIYFDNVGGEMLDIMLSQMKNFGVVIACGAISTYDGNLGYEFKNMWRVILARLRVEGFVVYDYKEENGNALDEIKRLIEEGKFKFIADERVGGVELAPSLFKDFYEGKNLGKFYLKIQ